VLIIQIVAALLLLLGTGLIFRALLELDASEPQPKFRPRHRAEPESDFDLPRAA